jgi:hypothetical protein
MPLAVTGETGKTGGTNQYKHLLVSSTARFESNNIFDVDNCNNHSKHNFLSANLNKCQEPIPELMSEQVFLTAVIYKTTLAVWTQCQPHWAYFIRRRPYLAVVLYAVSFLSHATLVVLFSVVSQPALNP